MAELNWNGRKLRVLRSEYQYGSCKQLALLCFDDSDPECSVASGNPYGVLTVNLNDPRCEPYGNGEHMMQFLDVNNWPGIDWIMKHDETIDWAQPTEAKQQSGFVTYPIWIFKVDLIEHV